MSYLYGPARPLDNVEEPEQGKEETYIAGDMLAPRNAQVGGDLGSLLWENAMEATYAKPFWS